MKNIYSILKDIGVEIPEDKKESFDKALNENYKTINEYNGLNTKLSNANTDIENFRNDIGKRDADLTALQEQLKQAGADKSKLEELNNQLTALQTDYDNAKTDYQKKIAEQKYEYAIRELTNGLQFTSNSAKKAFLNDAIAKGLTMEQDKVLGFQDFVNAYKEQDAGAFVVENNNNSSNDDNKLPHFSGSTNQLPPDKKVEEPKDMPIIW